MLLLKLWNFIRGYIVICVEGYFLEKFLNICTHRQIFLWDIKKHKGTSLIMKISIRGFRALRPIARKTKCRVSIIDKKGLPFMLNRYRRRKTFVAGAFIFIAVIYFLTSFIWEVEVSGNKELDQQYLLDRLSAVGVKPGVIKYGIDTDKVVNYLMHNIKELSWVSVSLRGTKVKVEVAERREIPELIDINTPCDIVAARDGIIKNIIVKNGVGVQKAGDTVVKGQVLISGLIPIRGTDGEVKPVHAMGSVIARTWYEENVKVSQQVIEKVRTGNYVDNIYISLIIKSFNLINREIKFENYDKIEIKKRVKLGEDIILPLEYVIERYYEEKDVIKEIDIEEAKELAAIEAEKNVLEKIPDNAKIVKSDLEYIDLEDGTTIARMTVECEEEIGVKKRLEETD
ncbi:MAG TPA: sporulation protein YqfD [Clostridiaceae bacterium]|nr:sporulation protein YqfD [Clostridiaceae bacterium]